MYQPLASFSKNSIIYHYEEKQKLISLPLMSIPWDTRTYTYPKYTILKFLTNHLKLFFLWMAKKIIKKISIVGGCYGACILSLGLTKDSKARTLDSHKIWTIYLWNWILDSNPHGQPMATNSRLLFFHYFFFFFLLYFWVLWLVFSTHYHVIQCMATLLLCEGHCFSMSNPPTPPPSNPN